MNNHEQLINDLRRKDFSDVSQDKIALLNAILGLLKEAGEIADSINRHVFYGQELDENNVIEELGDVEFFMGWIRQLIGVTREEVLEGNINKLKTRYPSGQFTTKEAVARADKETPWIV